jgi:hypothetical protein
MEPKDRQTEKFGNQWFRFLPVQFFITYVYFLHNFSIEKV